MATIFILNPNCINTGLNTSIQLTAVLLLGLKTKEMVVKFIYTHKWIAHTHRYDNTYHPSQRIQVEKADPFACWLQRSQLKSFCVNITQGYDLRSGSPQGWGYRDGCMHCNVGWSRVGVPVTWGIPLPECHRCWSEDVKTGKWQIHFDSCLLTMKNVRSMKANIRDDRNQKARVHLWNQDKRVFSFHTGCGGKNLTVQTGRFPLKVCEWWGRRRL